MKRIVKSMLLIAAMVVFVSNFAIARDQIKIVGSSTVYPFASYVAEEFGATTKYSTPVIESTGSGGGHKLTWVGDAMDTPDISNSSRRIKVSEFERAMNNGVEGIIENIIGYDGIVLANNKKAEKFKVSREDILLAVASEVPKNGKLVKNPYEYWDEINSDLPHSEILVYGPPTSSGTRDAFEDLVMEAASEEMPAYGGEYTKIRQDGVYVPSGENDNLIVQRLVKNAGAIGIFGYSFLEENQDRIQGAVVDGYEPTPENISSGSYPVSRSLFVYVKKAHIDKVPGVKAFMDLFLSEKMIGEYGYLKNIGLIPLPEKMRKQQRADWEERVVLELSDLK
jgi:phosphate transport system substrate-binding protein